MTEVTESATPSPPTQESTQAAETPPEEGLQAAEEAAGTVRQDAASSRRRLRALIAVGVVVLGVVIGVILYGRRRKAP